MDTLDTLQVAYADVIAHLVREIRQKYNYGNKCEFPHHKESNLEVVLPILSEQGYKAVCYCPVCGGTWD